MSDSPEQQSDPFLDLKYIVSHNQYGRYCVPESSRQRPAAQKILSNEVWEPRTIEFLVSNCAGGDIVHAGTYFGDFLPALSKGCAPNAKIWAFEPNLENYRCASKTIQLNELMNVCLTNAGLGAQQGSLFLEVSDTNGQARGGASRILSDEGRGVSAGIVSVQMVTIDDSVGPDRNISIIQLDVEGYEKEALSGALMTIQRCLPIILVEVLPKSTLLNSDWFCENILKAGYKMVDNIHGNSIFKHITK